MAAEAAEAAEERPRASMMAAPRLATVGMKSLSSQAWSTSTLLPPTSACWTEGYWVAEWLPQMASFLSSVTGTPSFLESWARARLWSRRGIAGKRAAGAAGAVGGGGRGGGVGGGAATAGRVA